MDEVYEIILGDKDYECITNDDVKNYVVPKEEGRNEVETELLETSKHDELSQKIAWNILERGIERGKKMALADLAEHDKEVRNKTIEEIIDSVDKMNNSGSHCVEDYCEDADSCTDCIAKAILRMLEQIKGEQT